MNLEIEKFRENLISLINESQLPIGVVFYVIKDCLNDISQAYGKAIKIEIENNKKPNDETEEELN